MDHILIIAVGAVVAGFVQGLSGFAFAMVAMSIWAWFLDPGLAVVLAVFGGLTGQVFSAITLRRGFDWPLVAPFLVGGLVGLPLGLLVLPHLNPTVFKALLGALLVTWCPLMLVGSRLPRLPASRWGDALAGLAGGLLGVLGGFTGAIPTLWCTLRGFPKESLRAVTQNFNLAMLAVTFATYCARGMVGSRELPSLLIVAAAVLVPVWWGSKMYIGLSDAAFRRVVMVLLTAAGAALLGSAITASPSA